MSDGSEIKLGRFGKQGKIDLNNDIKEGLQKDELFDTKLQSVFDSADTDGNGILSRDEVFDFRKEIKDTAGNSKLTKREARKFLKEKGLTDLKDKDLFSFLKKSQESAKSSKINSVLKNDAGQLLINSNDDRTAQVKSPDNSFESVQYADSQRKEMISKFDKSADGTELAITYGKENKKKEAVLTSTDGIVTRISYDDNEKPVERKIKTPTSDIKFDYDNGKSRTREVVEHNGNGDKTTKYDYNDDGTVTRTLTENGKTTKAVGGFDRDDPKLFVEGAKAKALNSEDKVDAQPKEVKSNTVKNELKTVKKGTVEKTVTTSHAKHSAKAVEQDAPSEVEDTKPETKATETKSNSAPSTAHHTTHSEAKHNTPSLTLHTKHSAKTVEQPKTTEVDAPAEVEDTEPETKATKTNSNSAPSTAHHTTHLETKHNAAPSFTSHVKHSESKKPTVTAHFDDGKPHKFEKIGDLGLKGYTYVRDPRTNKEHVISHDGTVLNDKYANEIILKSAYQNGKKVQGKFQGQNGKAVKGGSFVVVSEKPDKFGRKYVADKNGKIYSMAHDGTILKADYVKHTVFMDKVRTSKTTSQKATIAVMSKQLKTAQKAFQAQLDDDGWAGNVADGVSAVWGSKNRASKVRVDLQNYKNQINQLNKASKQGDSQFKATFKKIYGVNYNQSLVANYIDSPTQANYEKAFGRNNDIATRVAKYNQSQKTGAAVVKTTAAVGATVAVGVATGGTSLIAQAGVMATASATAGFSDRLSSHNGIKSGDTTQILEDAALDGAFVFAGGQVAKFAGKAITGTTKAAVLGRATTMAAGNAALGAGVEYAQTGDVTAKGVATGAAFGAVGATGELGVFKRAAGKVRVNAEAPKTPVVNSEVADVDAKLVEAKVPEVEANIPEVQPKVVEPKAPEVDIKQIDAKQRKLVEEAIDDTPSPAQQAKYDEEIAYKEPTAQEREVIDKNNSEAAEAYHEQHEIGNNISQKQAEALEKAKSNMAEPDVNVNGVYENEAGVFKMENGKVTEIKTTDGRVIQDELKIAKYLDKHDINLNDLK
ncbi:hypothetical protein KBA27_02250 [bacterium]|nr:hypothetical protein [bacterium]